MDCSVKISDSSSCYWSSLHEIDSVAPRSLNKISIPNHMFFPLVKFKMSQSIQKSCDRASIADLKLFTAYRMDCEDPNIRVIVSSLIDRLWLLAFEIRLLVIAFTGQCINYQVFLAFWFSEHGQLDQRASQEYRWIKAMNFPSLAFDTVRSFQIKISIIPTRKNQSVIGEINMSDSGQEIFYSLSSYVRFQIL